MLRKFWVSWAGFAGGVLSWTFLLGLGNQAWAVLDHFAISAIPDIATTASTASFTVTAYDAAGNTETSVGGTTSLAVFQNGVPLKTGVNTFGPATLTFTNGIYTGNLFVRKVGFNYSLRITNGGITNDSGVFNVLAPGAASKYIVCMPGQTLTPGEQNGSFWGRSGTPMQETAGVYFNVSVLVTDAYGNKVAASPTISAFLGQADTNAIFSPALPAMLPAVNAIGVTLTAAWTSPNFQTLSVSGGAYAAGNSGNFTVVANALDSFTVGNIGTSQTAGTGFNAQIVARDVYYNPVTTFSGPVYLTCPLLDYHAPEQSVIHVAGGAASGVTWTVASGFSGGVWSDTITVYRSGTGSLLVADQPNGTGHTGASATLTISAASFAKMFCQVPGLEPRPGVGGGAGNSLGGYAGIPNAQQAGVAFAVSVYATDDWWNNVSGVSDNFHSYTSPTDSNLQSMSWAFSNGACSLSTVLGTTASANAYALTLDCDTPGITDYTTPYTIPVAGIDHFKITSPDGVGGALPAALTAGVPFHVTIIAYTDLAETTVATTFNGQANLTTSMDYADPFRVVSPQRVTYTNGYWSGWVTFYRQAPAGITLQCQVGTAGSVVPNNPRVFHNARKKMLLLAPGMTAMPGVAPDTYPPGGFPGYTGNPSIQEAGRAFAVNFFLCDDYWNVVTNTAGGGNHSIQVTSSDPYPAGMNGSSLPQNVNLTSALGYLAGAYTSSQFKLFRLGSNGYQTVTVHDNDDAGVADFTLGGNGVPPVSLCHTKLAVIGGPGNTYAFKIDAASSAKLAGQAFLVTLTAQDQYGNPMDNRNGAMPFSESNNINLNLGTGSNTLYPTVVQTSFNGVGLLFLTAYKECQGIGTSINAMYSDADGFHIGYSNAFLVNANAFTRLIPIVPGMDIQGGGAYTAQPPMQFLGYSGSPDAQTAGQRVNVRVYACDTYGNVTEGATDFVTLASSDIFAPLPQAKNIDWNSGYADFSAGDPYAFRYHRAAPGNMTASDISNGAIASGTTPDMLVDPGPAYGMAMLAPGQVLVGGSGNSGCGSVSDSGITGVAPLGWYTGVTPANPGASPEDVYQAGGEVTGLWFPVTITVTDVFGNRRMDNYTNFQVWSNDSNDAAVPKATQPVVGAFSAGLGYMWAKLVSLGGMMLYPENLSSPGLNHAMESRSDITVVSQAETHFKIYINGVGLAGPVVVQAAPNTFTVRVEVCYDTTHEIVGTANVGYHLEAFADAGSNTPGAGSLALSYGQTNNGVAEMTETYTAAGILYLRVREYSGNTRPTLSTSAQINVTPSKPAQILMTADAPVRPWGYELPAGNTATVFASVFDMNNNPIAGDIITFTIDPIFSSRLGTNANPLTATACPANVSGTAQAQFLARGNEAALVRAVSKLDPATTGMLQLNVLGAAWTPTLTPSATATPTQTPTLTATPTLNLDQVIDLKGKKVLAYPNPGRGQIRFALRLEHAAGVKVVLYNLMGERVGVVEEALPAGMGVITWVCKNTAPGIYLARVYADGREITKLKVCVAR